MTSVNDEVPEASAKSVPLFELDKDGVEVNVVELEDQPYHEQ